MKVIIEAEARAKDSVEKRKSVSVEFEELGSQAYVRMTIQGVEYDFGYGDFWDAVRATCISSL